MTMLQDFFLNHWLGRLDGGYVLSDASVRRRCAPERFAFRKLRDSFSILVRPSRFALGMERLCRRSQKASPGGEALPEAVMRCSRRSGVSFTVAKGTPLLRLHLIRLAALGTFPSRGRLLVEFISQFVAKPA